MPFQKRVCGSMYSTAAGSFTCIARSMCVDPSIQLPQGPCFLNIFYMHGQQFMHVGPIHSHFHPRDWFNFSPPELGDKSIGLSQDWISALLPPPPPLNCVTGPLVHFLEFQYLAPPLCTLALLFLYINKLHPSVFCLFFLSLFWLLAYVISSFPEVMG